MIFVVLYKVQSCSKGYAALYNTYSLLCWKVGAFGAVCKFDKRSHLYIPAYAYINFCHISRHSPTPFVASPLITPPSTPFLILDQCTTSIHQPTNQPTNQLHPSQGEMQQILNFKPSNQVRTQTSYTNQICGTNVLKAQSGAYLGASRKRKRDLII